MKSLAQLINFLDSPDDEIWGNIYLALANEIFENDHQELIPIILKDLNQWSSNRQEHLACLLGFIGSSEEKNLISELVRSDDFLVNKRALEAMDEFNSNK